MYPTQQNDLIMLFVWFVLITYMLGLMCRNRTLIEKNIELRNMLRQLTNSPMS